MKEINPERKQRIFNKVKATFLERYGDEIPINRACVFLTKIGMEVIAKELPYRALVQAGSMNWEIVPPEKDDGKILTHFGFEWSPYNAISQAAMAQGLLPEMHVWIALPELQEIIDFATAGFPEFVTDELHLDWMSPPPPAFLWTKKEGMPRGCYYTPNLEATRLAMIRIAQLHTQEMFPAFLVLTNR